MKKNTTPIQEQKLIPCRLGGRWLLPKMRSRRPLTREGRCLPGGGSYILHIAALSLLVCTAADAATVTSTLQASNSLTKHVTESAIIGHTNASNQEVTTTAYMQFDGAQYDIYTVTKVGNSVFPPTRVDPYTTNGKLGDPVLAVNPWTRRIYLAAIEDPSSIYQGILNVWYSDDGGQIWVHKTAKRSTTGFIDRPSITVSWYPDTLGEIYVAALVENRIQVYRNSNNGDYPNPNVEQYEEVGSVPRTNGTQSPSIGVDPTTGNVYLFWVDWVTNEIRAAKSPNRGGAFEPLPSLQLGPGTMLTPLFSPTCSVDSTRSCDNICYGDTCIKADSSIAQRYNLWSNTFGVVWHQRNPNDLADKTTDIKFSYYDPAGNYWLTPPVTVNRFSGGDQWHPAIDFDNHGEYLVTYYDNRDSNPSDFTYRVYATRLDPWGTRIGGDSRVTVKAANAASLLPLDEVRPDIFPSYIHSMGEYHDLWWWKGHWTDSYIFAPDGATDDVYMTTLIRGARASVPADFTGDGVSDYMIYNGGAWIDYSHNSGVWTGEPSANCIPAPADYDGDGTADFALLCDGAWHFYNADGSYKKGIWVGNVAGQFPVPADYNGDGKDEVVIYRDGLWLAYDYDSGSATWTVNTGVMSDAVPVPMDYDGDGTADFTVYRLARAWHFYTDSGAYVKGIWIGAADGIPVPGDYNADGKEDVAVFAGGGAWHFFDFDTLQYHGVWTGVNSFNGDPVQPAPLDYDGDGTVDFTVHAGGPWHFWNHNGTYNKGVWCGGVRGSQAISRKQHINP